MLHIPRLRFRGPFSLFILTCLILSLYYYLNPSLGDSDVDSRSSQPGRSGFGLIQDRVVYSRSRKEKLLAGRSGGESKQRVTKGKLSNLLDTPPVGSQRLPSSSSNAGHGPPFVAGERSDSTTDNFGGLGRVGGGIDTNDDQDDGEHAVKGGSGWMGKASDWAAGVLRTGGKQSGQADDDWDEDALPGLGQKDVLLIRDGVDGDSDGTDAKSKASPEDRVEGAIAPKMGNETLKAELGRATWKFLHILTLRYPLIPTPTERTTLSTFFTTFSLLYPCGECASHFQQLLKEYPPQTSGRKAASEWLCVVHNKVNERLGKEEFDCAALGDIYDCGCGDEELDDSAGETGTSGVTKDSVNDPDPDDEESDEQDSPPKGSWINPKSNILSGLTDPNGLVQAAQNRLRAGKARAAKLALGTVSDGEVEEEKEGVFGSGIMGFEADTVRGMVERDAAKGLEKTPLANEGEEDTAQEQQRLPARQQIAQSIEQRERELGLPNQQGKAGGRGKAAEGQVLTSGTDTTELQIETGSDAGMAAIIKARARRQEKHRAEALDQVNAGDGRADWRALVAKIEKEIEENDSLTPRQIESRRSRIERIKSGKLVTGTRSKGRGGSDGEEEADVSEHPQLREIPAGSLPADFVDPLRPVGGGGGGGDWANSDGPDLRRQKLLDEARGRRKTKGGNRVPKYPSSVKKKTDGGWLADKDADPEERKAHPLGVLLEEGQNANKFGFEKYYEEEVVEIEPFMFSQDEGDEAV